MSAPAPGSGRQTWRWKEPGGGGRAKDKRDVHRSSQDTACACGMSSGRTRDKLRAPCFRAPMHHHHCPCGWPWGRGQLGYARALRPPASQTASQSSWDTSPRPWRPLPSLAGSDEAFPIQFCFHVPAHGPRRAGKELPLGGKSPRFPLCTHAFPYTGGNYSFRAHGREVSNPHNGDGLVLSPHCPARHVPPQSWLHGLES